jgi:hypothetical protein
MSYNKNNGPVLSRTYPHLARPFVITMILTTAALFIGAVRSASAQTNVVRGTVSVSTANGPNDRLPGSTVNLVPAESGKTARTTVTNDQGEYEFTNVAPGTYTLQIILSGFKQSSSNVTVHVGEPIQQNVQLEIEEVSGNVTVTADAEELSINETAHPASFKQEKLQTVPLSNERFQDAIPLVPGVVRGPDGLLNVKGARANQSALTVNSANVDDPVTGESGINLPLEAIQSVEVVTNPYAPEYGEFTGAVTAVQTRSGSEKFNANVQSFFPRPRRRGGSFVGIGAFTPRVTFSGPIIKDKVRFMQSFEYRFVRTPVESLPPLKRDTGLESFDSVSQIDWDIDARDHVTTTFSLFPEKLRYVGLNTFNPQEVTPNFKQRGFLWAVNERRILSAKSLLESTFSIKQFDADVFPSSGTAPMNFAPDVNSGNFFNQQARRSRRYDSLEVYSFSPPNFAGSHFMKLAAGISYVSFDGRNINNTVRILRADGTRDQEINFAGSGQLKRNKTELVSYFSDKWSINRRLTIDYGVRYDHDNIASENNFAPRIGFAFLPVIDGRTVVRGGIGVFYDTIDLNVATFPQLQNRILTRYGLDGQELIGLPVSQRYEFTDGKIRTPRSINWNIEVDREWIRNLFVRVGYAQRQGQHEFVLNPGPIQNNESILGLSNSGSSRYRELQITTRYKFRERDEFVASYVRSSSRGDLNDFNSYYGNFENPIIQPNERTRLPWDSPDRFLFWGEFHAKYGITVSPVLDIRTGFPYSIINEERSFVGPRNQAGRFPTFASIDLQVLKSVSLPGRWKKYQANLGLKVFNLTNHFNPRDFQNNLASDSFGVFSNGVGRMYGTRISFSKK